MSLTLFEHVGLETLAREYKEFYLRIDTLQYYSEKEIEDIVTNGNLNKTFNKVIMENLKNFMQYIPKYVSSFGNCKECDSGTLYIGINNTGEVTGIPFLGAMKEKTIKKWIKKSIKKHVITTDKTKEILLKNISFNLKKVNINSCLIESDLDEKIKKKQELFETVKKEKEIYVKKWNAWYNELSQFSGKLKNILNKNYYDIYQYILDHDSTKIHVFSQVHEMDSLIEHIRDKKDDKDTLIYWVCSYRDYILKQIIQKKPKKSRYMKYSFSYAYEFNNLDQLRKKFLENNKDIQYYILEIHFLTSLDDDVFYTDKSKSIKKRVRIERDGEPISI
jgi:hypothetical protein